TRYLARVENNLGFILLQLGRTTEALSHLNKARTIFISLKDSGSVAQVNETRARVFLAEKRFAEAERAIFGTVSVLEQGEESSLLAEALMTEGSIFARSGKHDSARAAFSRASEVAAAAGDSHLAAAAQLRMIEEMIDVLSVTELLALYRSADQYAGNCASQSEQQGLRFCRRMLMDKLEQALHAEEELIGGTLEEEKNHFEGRLIARALEQENGSVTRAARMLGVTHQELSKILDGRHNTLAGNRRPKRNRRRSIMRKD